VKYSLTQGGILVAVVGTLVVQLGFSDSCSNEITQKLVDYAPLVIGGITAWIGRFRAGGVTMAGFRK